MPFNILVVDDEPDWRATFDGLLRDCGHQVRVAADEHQALDACADERFDFALIDWRLHGHDDGDDSGLWLCANIRKRPLNLEVQVILVTGHQIRPRLVAEAIKYYGAVDLVEKDANVSRDVVRAIGLESRRLADPLPDSSYDPVALFDLLTRYLSVEELKTLCFRLGVEYDSLDGETKSGKARELVKHLDRHQRLNELVEIFKSDYAFATLQRIRARQSGRP